MAKPSVSVLPLLLLGALLATETGCTVEVATARPRPPAPPPRPPAPPPPAPRPIARRPAPVPQPGVVPVHTPPAVQPTGGIPVMVGSNVFGNGTVDVAGWKGSYYTINPNTTKLPTLAGTTPNGTFFTHDLNVANRTMTGGFPGIDPTRNENFALRFEAPLVVDTESDYSFRLVSDDGSALTIDGTSIVENDGAHAVTEKIGPVHLVTGTHSIAVDYFQGTGPVALQLFCTKAGGSEQVCPTHLY